MSSGNRTRINFLALRTFVGVVAGVAMILGFLMKHGSGSYCSFRVRGLHFTCPLGFLQLLLAGRGVAPRTAWLGGAFALLAIIVVGRAFCAWICPATILHNLFRKRGSAHAIGMATPETRTAAIVPFDSANGLSFSVPHAAAPEGSGRQRSVAYGILGGSLLSSAIFGFPVFCLLCPVGLTIGIILAVVQLFATLTPGWELFVFPLLLGLELTLLRRWCQTLCPLGALLTLLSRVNVFLRLRSDTAMCHSASWSHCRVCSTVCPEQVKVSAQDGMAGSRCTKCLECYSACPSHSRRIEMLPLPWRRNRDTARE